MEAIFRRGPLIKVFAAVRLNTYHPQATFQSYPDLMPPIIYLFPHFSIYQVHRSLQSYGQLHKLAAVAQRLQRQARDGRSQVRNVVKVLLGKACNLTKWTGGVHIS